MNKKDLVFDQSKVIVSKVAQVKIVVKRQLSWLKEWREALLLRNDRKMVE